MDEQPYERWARQWDAIGPSEMLLGIGLQVAGVGVLVGLK